jgi:RNA-directed DNA polymerase
MSAAGRTASVDVAAVSEILDPKWLLRHRHSASDFLVAYRRLASEAAARRLVGLRALAPHLLDYISDEKTLAAALDHMMSNGSHATGPDGVTYDSIASPTPWPWCRAMRDTIRDGEYGLGPERVQRIPKGSGRGYRELVIQGVVDRVVARAVADILGPLLDPLFVPHSFGFRPGKGPLRALATAERLWRSGSAGVWVSCDVRNAFPSVPVGRLAGVLHKYLPDDDLLDFLAVVIRLDKRPGLRQGSPLSPLMLNLYLHHLLDRDWRKIHPALPLLRFADDILLVCPTLKQARGAYTALADRIRSAGLSLKESAGEAVWRLDKGQVVNWMGFGIRQDSGNLLYSLTEDAWASLAAGFATSHERSNPPLAATASLCGWLGSTGPCYPSTDMRRAYARIRHLGERQGFDELPDAREVRTIWQAAFARWCRLRSTTTSQTLGGK